MRTSLEIVPRTVADLDATAQLIAARYPRIETVNIPDRPNCDVRSVDAAAHLRGRIAHRIPHLRACDFDPTSALRLVDSLATRQIGEVIVVAGDHDGIRPGFEPTALIEFLTTHAKNLAVFAALDPHRYRDDVALARNIERKRAAGAAGFFTQPLFDLRDIDRCAPLLGGATTFWGLSPVVSDRSQRYWQRVNGVEFPAEFTPTLPWNHAFALRFLSEIADRGGNAYLMPIKVDIERYLEPLQARFAAR
jgi:methylenetetrahydrofolate reductase (NADPH)